MDGSTNLCQVSTGQEQDWKDLYNSAFPADERTPLEELQRLLDAGSILLHRTTNKSGELLCFSIVYPMSNFALLSYIASDSTKRSTGIGSKHMKKLLEILKTKYPEFLGLVLEIESTRQQGLEAADKTARQRRLAFYPRLGAKRLCRTYVWPSYSLKGTYRLAELMWFDFDPATIDDPQLPGIIKELYMKGYGAQEDDPILELVIHQFKCSDKTGSAAVICPAEPADKGDKSKSADKKDASVKADDSASTVKPADAVKTEDVPAVKTEDTVTGKTEVAAPAPDAATAATPEVVTSTPVTTSDEATAETPATTDSTVVKDAPEQPVSTPSTSDDSPAVEPKKVQKKDKKSKGAADKSVSVPAANPQGEKGGDRTKDGA